LVPLRVQTYLNFSDSMSPIRRVVRTRPFFLGLNARCRFTEHKTCQWTSY